jgi:hypothetical protein
MIIPFGTNKIIIPEKITKMSLYIRMEKNREWQIELNIPAMEKEMATFGPILAIGGRRKRKGRNLVGRMEINQNNKLIIEMRERAFSDEKNSTDSTPIFHLLGQNDGHSLEGVKIQFLFNN